MIVGALGSGLLSFGYLYAISIHNVPMAIVMSLLMWGVVYQGYNAVFPSFYPEMFPTRTRVSGMAISQNIGTAITALLPALFVAVAPPGATDIPMKIGAITLPITIVAAIAAWSARETYRVHLNDLGKRDAAARAQAGIRPAAGTDDHRRPDGEGVVPNLIGRAPRHSAGRAAIAARYARFCVQRAEQHRGCATQRGACAVGQAKRELAQRHRLLHAGLRERPLVVAHPMPTAGSIALTRSMTRGFCMIGTPSSVSATAALHRLAPKIGPVSNQCQSYCWMRAIGPRYAQPSAFPMADLRIIDVRPARRGRGRQP